MSKDSEQKREIEGQKQKEEKVQGMRWEPRVPLFRSDSPSCSTCNSAAEHEKQKKVGMITRNGEDMLIKVYRKPMVLTELYKELGLSGYMGGKTKWELIKEGLVYEVELPTNRRGRRKKLLQITQRGTEYLRELGIKDIRKGRGGVKHLYYQKILKEWYQANGYVVEVEASVGDTCLDVLVIRKDGERLGIEIALSEQYEQTNARKAMQAGLEGFMFVCETKELMERLHQRLSSMIESWPGKKPGFKLINDYMSDY